MGTDDIDPVKRKRDRVVFKKLLFLNMERMLKILKYKPTEGDRKRIKYSMEEYNMLDVSVLSHRSSPAKSSPKKSVNQDQILSNLGEFEQRVIEMGQQYPRLNTAMTQMKHEMDQLRQ